ncbi:uncharacterized protein EDB91DRAFT_1240167 [Suillus paluster]|uniref:uncharacterized protein n=1 Tax=Suillus paluster TaxID=48578 RepID=UPI001B87406D|nr:uncharacterized protein EDB91DRAFT_1240167 [Suillus paluster]KAG1722940.1 hypothetical protein EDB91DRAFT_1240167 [Suillus paluster]
MGPSHRQHDKGLKCRWYVLNAAHQASQRQNLSACTVKKPLMHHKRPLATTELHKHTSHTITGPGRVSMHTEYFLGPTVAPSVPAVAPETPDSPLNDNGHNESINFDVVDGAYMDYLAEMDEGPKNLLRLDGRGDYVSQDSCQGCAECPLPPLYRCKDCFSTELYCQRCTVEKHHANPLHRIERWNDGYFAHTTLKILGLRVQLGHPSGECCYSPSTAFHDDFIVLNISSVHEIALDFCGCEIAQSPVVQLLRTRLYPSMTVDPKSAATFHLLHHFHILSFKSKASVFEYWQTLARLTDNTGVSPPKDRCGHDPAGVCAATPGACTVLCAACPQPGKNMPDGWEKALPEVRWKYALFLAIDANFRLARKNVSSDKLDPSLSQGWSYFVEERGFKSFLNEAGTLPQEKSTCASHSAVNLADTKNARGLATTGVGTVDCARHNLKRPCAVGDLQKGERYINMDYLLFSTLQQTRDVMVLNISYDITCQWSKNLWDHMSRYPSAIHFNHSNKTVIFLVPKFHLPAHIAACQITFSYNLVKGVGRTDGEAPERGWANINPVATSTREMGPGSWRDTLDDHFGDFNWKKVTNFGISLLRKIKSAIPERDLHVCDFDDFNHTLSQERPNEVKTWKSAVEIWEEDRSQPNPFKIKSKLMSQAAVRLSLSQKEARDLECGVNVFLHSDISPSILISSGIDYEDQQCCLQRDHHALGDHATDLQLAKFQERSNTLQRKIAQWCKIQLLYLPSVACVRTSDIESSIDSTQEEKPYDIKLWLPSQIRREMLLPCNDSLSEYEWDLWRAQAFDALDDLCRYLRLRTHLYKFKDAQIRGQRANTRAGVIIKNVEINVSMAAERYRRAWNALSALAPSLARNAWMTELPKLEEGDTRGMGDSAFGESSGNRTLSWIWKAQGVATAGVEGEAVLSEALRVEWCRSRARANRWVEEVELLLEEMWRVGAFLAWHAAWWEEQATRRVGLDDASLEGIRGYAKCQAALRRSMRDIFLSLRVARCAD